MNNNDIQAENLSEWIKYIMTLEYLGIHIIDSGKIAELRNESTGNPKEDDLARYMNRLLGPKKKLYYRITVPKYSLLIVDDEVVKDIIGDRPCSSSEDLINIAKLIIRQKMSKVGVGKEELAILEKGDWEEFVNDYMKIYVKVREDDIWDTSKAEGALKKVLDSMRNIANGYKEV